MCGGRGTRLGMGEKPLVEVGGEPMVDRVIAAVSPVADAVHAAPSPHTPETRAHLDGRVPVVETPGEGYVDDLSHALARVGRPVLTVTADLPLLTPADVRLALDAHGPGSLTVCVPVERKRELGVSVDRSFEHEGQRVAPTGVNVVGEGPESIRTLDRIGLAVNVNRSRDLQVAEVLFPNDCNPSWP
ncbi:NTP transferase domain-containing protein [Halalkalicoccus sp. NIPERK01]|uniref:NTP transferase domain-containing protein n=1 Tax=Halalkalicoccus sp. NIPERK01 TaxID=3053469 RepID=UPI00256F4D8E|nr:NTP transferase domain-containing protein [Halalkalicoccus sp. NIPERK01]MDL5361665.1 NTP transferase domain-containing protein [Halalkalicoccus sp. NIPERK01]